MEFELEILRTGNHTAGSGHGFDVGIAELNEIADSYNPAVFKAPFILGHDTKGVADADLVNHPELAYGAPSRLKVVGDRLKAVFDDISPKVVEWYKAKNLLSVSPSIYPRDSARNPSKGKLSLRHVAGTGVNPPAIFGLASDFAQPSDDDLLTFTFDFAQDLASEASAESTPLVADDKPLDFGANGEIETADKFLPSGEVGTVREDWDLSMLETRFEWLQDRVNEIAEAVLPKESPLNYQQSSMDELTPEQTAKQAELDAREAKFAARERDLNRQDFRNFCQTELHGRLIPAIATVDDVVDFMELFHNSSMDFSGDATAHPLERFKAMLRNLPQQIDFSEVAKGPVPTVDTGASDFAEEARKRRIADRENAWKQS